jgi:tRNA G10  N-methylase Trm11
MADASVDAIVTHPPYIGSIPYAEYGLLSLVWLGHDPRKLDNQLTGGRRQSSRVVERFEEGFREMLSEAGRVLKPHKMMVMLVGSPLVKGKRVDLAEMAKRLGSHAGFDCVATHTRAGTNRRANLMGAESLLFFERGSN